MLWEGLGSTDKRIESIPFKGIKPSHPVLKIWTCVALWKPLVISLLEFAFFFRLLSGKKLFGEGYSGLEYDYRGLIKLYNSIGNYEKVFEYHNVLSNWNRLRDRQYSVTDALEDVNTSPQSTEEVVQSFLISQNVEGPSCWGRTSVNQLPFPRFQGIHTVKSKPCCFLGLEFTLKHWSSPLTLFGWSLSCRVSVGISIYSVIFSMYRMYK